MTSRLFRIAAAAGLSACLAAGAAHAQTKIVFNSFAPPNFVFNQGMIDVWAKKVGEITEGRVVVEIPATSLAPPQQQWEMVTQGVADGAYIFNAFAQKRLLLPQIAHLPFVTPSAVAEGVALWRTHKKFFEAANEYEGVVLIGFFGSPPPYMWSMKEGHQIVAIDSLKGVKTWSLPGDNSRAMDKLGAVIVSGPAVRSYEIISKGIVDAYVGHNYDGGQSFNVTQFATSVTEIPGGIGSASFSIFLNKDKWDSIDKRDQDLIMSISGEALARSGSIWDDREKTAREKAKSEGRLEILTASDQLMADLRQAWSFLEDEWIANANSRGVDGKAALEFYKQTVAEIAQSGS
jgi:TRAP-type C4-dicarboxylate transport system substrate-binding protein